MATRRTRILPWFAVAGSGLIALAATGVVFERLCERADVRRCPPPGRLHEAGEHLLHAVCEGQGSPTVILEHTGVGGLLQYDELRRLLAPATRVCAYDRAGMGWSGPHSRPLTAGSLVEDLRVLLDTVEAPQPYVLVAGSVGGMTALMFARRYSDEVAGLVLLDAVDETTIDRMPEIAGRLSRLAGTARAASWVGLLRVADPFGLGQLPSADAACARRIVYRNAHWDAVASVVRNWERSAHELASAPPLSRDLPLVVIRHGVVGDLLGPGDPAPAERLEPLWQELQHELAERSDRGRLLVAPEGGHLIAVDQPDLVAREVLRLMDELRTDNQ